MRLRAFLALSLLVGSSIALGQKTDQPFSEQLDVNLVLVDATVTDRKGNQILGLGKDDFIVKENGVPQEIASVEYFTNRTLLDSPESEAAFQVELAREERYFILFFDRSTEFRGFRSARAEVIQAREAAKRFVREHLQPGDRVAVMAYDMRLRIFGDFTTDRKTILSALDEVVGYSEGIIDNRGASGDESILAHIDMDAVLNRTVRIYNAIGLVADATRQIKARKVMMLFSAGIGTVEHFGPSAGLLQNDIIRYEPMLHALNRANVTVAPIQLFRNTRYYPTEQTLDALASDTGGEYFRNVVDYVTPMKNIERFSSGYYLLSYYANHRKGSSGYQKIDVDVRNRKFHVTARRGYAY